MTVSLKPRRKSGRVTARAPLLLFVWAAGLLAVVLQSHFAYAELTIILVETTVVLVAGTVTLSWLLRTGFWSPGTLMFIVIGLFHLGLVPFWAFGIDPEFARVDDYVWFTGDVGARALFLVLTAMVSYVLGATAYVAFSSYRVGDSTVALFVPNRRANHYSIAGAAIALVGIIGWFAVGVLAGGPQIFFGSYASWLEETADSALISIIYMMIGGGVALAALGASSRIVKIAAIAFVVFALVAFFLGLRGEVLFPTAVAASVLAFRRRMPSAVLALASGGGILVLISAANIIRQLGVRGTGFNWSQASPLSALAEMGSTLRVVATTVMWHSPGGDQFRGGDTYTVSVARLFESIVDPLHRPPASADFRLMNSEVMARAGKIGGSIVGEAFHNFALPGVIVIFLVLGLLFGYFSNMRFSATRIAVYICAAVPLFNHVRNSFVPVLPMFLVGLVLLLGARLVGDILDGRTNKR